MVRRKMKIEIIRKRLAMKEEQLEKAYEAYTALLSGGVKSYAIGSRNLTKIDLPQLEDSIKKLEDDVKALECLLGGQSPRKAVRVIPRDL